VFSIITTFPKDIPEEDVLEVDATISDLYLAIASGVPIEEVLDMEPFFTEVYRW